MSTPTLTHAISEAGLAERFGLPKPEIASKVQPRLNDWMKDFIRHSPFMVLATSTSSGACDVSPKGGGPGFVTILDDQTLLVPDYRGNNLFFGHKNLMDNPQVALLFLIPGETWTMRVTGHAQIVDDEASIAAMGAAPHGETPRLGLKIYIDECFSQCPKALVRSDIWNPEQRTRVPKRPDPPGGWMAEIQAAMQKP